MDKRTELETDKGRTEDDARRVYMYTWDPQADQCPIIHREAEKKEALFFYE